MRLPSPLLLERRYENTVPLPAAALQGHARDLCTQGLGADLAALVAEARALREGGAGARP